MDHEIVPKSINRLFLTEDIPKTKNKTWICIIYTICKIFTICTCALLFLGESREPLRRRQSQGGLHRHDACVQLRSGDTDHSPRLETALLQWDPVHSWPLQRTAGRCADISRPIWNGNIQNMSNIQNMYNIENYKSYNDLHVKQSLGHSHAQVLLQLFRGRSRMKNLGLENLPWLDRHHKLPETHSWLKQIVNVTLQNRLIIARKNFI